MPRHSAPKPPPNPNFAQQPMSSILKAGLPPSQPRPPLKYATAAAAAVTPSASQQSNASVSPSVPTQVVPPVPVQAPVPAPPPPKPESVATTTLQDTITAVTSSPSLTQISTSSPFLSSTSASAQQPDGSFGSPLVSEAESHPEPSVSASAPSPLGAGESCVSAKYLIFLLCFLTFWNTYLPSDGQARTSHYRKHLLRYVSHACGAAGRSLIGNNSPQRHQHPQMGRQAARGTHLLP